MIIRLRRYVLWGGLVALGLALWGDSAYAAYTKLYSFTNNTGIAQTSARATTLGLESITALSSAPSGWTPAQIGYVVLSGVYCTTITYGHPAVSVASNSSVTIGLSTADNSCRLRDLRWGSGQSIVPTQLSGVPGGGLVLYDFPNSGDLTVIITNDTTSLLNLTTDEFATVSTALEINDLEALLISDFVQLRVDAIDRAIAAIRAEIVYHRESGEIASPSDTSLLGKLDRAVAYKESGLAAYLDGNMKSALSLWGKAAQQMTNFIAEVKNASDKGNLPPYLYMRWIITGGAGLPMTAPQIQNALLTLPNGPSLFSFPGLPADIPLPGYTGLDPAYRIPWPTDILNPGEYTAFVVSGLDLGAGFILRGSVVDEFGNEILNWLEQGVAEPPIIDTQAPVITYAAATPAYLWSPDHTMRPIALDVTVEDDTYAVWFVAGVTSNQPENGTGDGDYAPDWWIDPENIQSLWLRSERSGNDPTGTRIYTVILQAIDGAGNLSDPYELLIPVDHDQG